MTSPYLTIQIQNLADKIVYAEMQLASLQTLHAQLLEWEKQRPAAAELTVSSHEIPFSAVAPSRAPTPSVSVTEARPRRRPYKRRTFEPGYITIEAALYQCLSAEPARIFTMKELMQGVREIRTDLADRTETQILSYIAPMLTRMMRRNECYRIERGHYSCTPYRASSLQPIEEATGDDNDFLYTVIMNFFITTPPHTLQTRDVWEYVQDCVKDSDLTYTEIDIEMALLRLVRQKKLLHTGRDSWTLKDLPKET